MEIEFSVLNIIFVTLSIFVIYVIGYIHGFSKGLTSYLSKQIDIFSNEKVYKYVIEGVEYISTKELEVRQLRLEQYSDVFYAYDMVDNSYICRASSKEEFFEEIKKYAYENKQYDKLYWISAEDIKRVAEVSND